MNKQDLFPYIAYALDDSGEPRNVENAPDDARIVAWQCGFEPLAVIVWSYTGAELPDQDAEEMAADYLEKIEWFDGEPLEADYIL
ncbi:hypothetical protein [Thiohalorhabdus sp.]|uniref:hypothetical protein n=1 Tax=Thiohalorhabdus sp. TaxID=3094134 RepID=UPI002FC30CF7